MGHVAISWIPEFIEAVFLQFPVQLVQLFQLFFEIDLVLGELAQLLVLLSDQLLLLMLPRKLDHLLRRNVLTRPQALLKRQKFVLSSIKAKLWSVLSLPSFETFSETMLFE